MPPEGRAKPSRAVGCRPPRYTRAVATPPRPKSDEELRAELEARELRDGAWTVRSSHGDEERVRLPPFEAIELPLSRMWLA